MPVLIMMNKPKGFITAARDARKATVCDLLPPDLREKVHPVGRLDIDTTGLLLFTDDGRYDHALLMPGHHIDKKYEFYAMGSLNDEKLALLQNGVCLTPGGKPTEKASVGDIRYHRIREIKEYLPLIRRQRYMKNPDGSCFSASLTIHEGRKHQVKLMLRSVGCRIVWLKRTRLGSLALDPSLKEGEWRELTAQEKESLDSEAFGARKTKKPS